MFHSVFVYICGYEPLCEQDQADLGLSLLQQGLQPLLGSATLMVIADNQDDVVPPKLPHQVKPDLCLVGIRRHGPQERQVDALQRRRYRLTQLALPLMGLYFIQKHLSTHTS